MATHAPAPSSVHVWDPSHLFAPPASASNAPPPPFALIILNAPISASQRSIFLALWQRATLRLCADGGANRLLDAFGRDAFGNQKDGQEGQQVPLPHEIRGDLDSMRSDTRAFFDALNVPITKRDSQYATDLQKCIKAVEFFEQGRHTPSTAAAAPTPTPPDVELELVIYGGLSGRFDQTAHTLHVLWLLGAAIPPELPQADVSLEPDEDAVLARRARVWVVGDGCLVWILDAGRHRIHAFSPPLGPTCGLLPFGTTTGAKIVTSGLRWNLDGQTRSSLPGFWSTSNQIEFMDDQAEVEITTDHPMYWSIELQGESED